MKSIPGTFAASGDKRQDSTNSNQKSMKEKIILTHLLVCIGVGIHAQDTKTEKPEGKAIVQVFSNLHTGFNEKSSDMGFELERSYLGYEHLFGKGLSAKGVLDVGQSKDVNDYHRIAYIKNAMVSWNKGNLTLNGGLIPTTQFDFQEKFWNYRYIMKSFQDQYSFGSSADLGLSIAYKFTDRISADAILVNGEGYKKVQVNNGLNYGLGLTLTPAKGFRLRLYGGLNESGMDGKANIVNMTAFAGYKNTEFTLGAEYSHMLNASYTKGNDLFGYSVFGFVRLAEYADLYARFDALHSKDDWNADKDGQTAILGVQLRVGRYVKIAPNLRMTTPKATGARNCYYAYVNCYFGL